MLCPKESLCFRCILKPAHSSEKLRLSRLLKSITFWAPTWIVKNVQKSQILTEGAISTARVTCRSPSDMAYASPCISLHIRVCRLSIGPLVTEISAREATRPERFFAFFTNFAPRFLHANPMTQIRTFPARATRSSCTPATPFLDVEMPQFVLYKLCKFHPATRHGLGCTWSQMAQCRDHGHRQTNKQTHPRQIVI